MTGGSDIREKARAVFLAFVMITSVFGATVALTGGAAGAATQASVLSPTPTTSGSTVNFNVDIDSGSEPVQVFVDTDRDDDVDASEVTKEIGTNTETIDASKNSNPAAASAGDLIDINGDKVLVQSQSGGDVTLTGTRDTAFADGDNLKATSFDGSGSNIGTVDGDQSFGANEDTLTLTASSDFSSSISPGDIIVVDSGTGASSSAEDIVIAIESAGTSDNTVQVVGQNGVTLDDGHNILLTPSISVGSKLNGDAAINGNQDIDGFPGGSQTVSGSISLSGSTTGTVRIGFIQQDSKLTAGDGPADTATNDFNVRENLQGSGDGRVDYQITPPQGSPSATQNFAAGRNNVSLGLIQLKDVTDGGSFAGETVITLPDGVTVNQSASTLTTNQITTSQSGSGTVSITDVSVSPDGSEITLTHDGTSAGGETIRFSSGSLVVNTDASQFDTSSATTPLDVDVDYALSTLTASGLLTANSPTASTSGFSPLEVNNNGGDLSSSSFIQVGNIDTLSVDGNRANDREIGNDTEIVVSIQDGTGVTFDKSVEGSTGLLNNEDIDNEASNNEFDSEKITVTDKELRIPVVDPIEGTGNSLQIDTTSSGVNFNTTGSAAQNAHLNVSVQATGPSTAYQLGAQNTETLTDAISVNSPALDFNQNTNNGDVSLAAGANSQVGLSGGSGNQDIKIDLSQASVPKNSFVNITTNSSAVTFDTSSPLSGDGSDLTYQGSLSGPSLVQNVTVTEDEIGIGIAGSDVGGSSSDAIIIPTSTDNQVEIALSTQNSNPSGSDGQIVAIPDEGKLAIQDSSSGSTLTLVGVPGTGFSDGAEIKSTSFSGSGADIADVTGSPSATNNIIDVTVSGTFSQQIERGDILVEDDDTDVSDGDGTQTNLIALESASTDDASVLAATDASGTLNNNNLILATDVVSVGSNVNGDTAVNGDQNFPSFPLNVSTSLADESKVQFNLTNGPVELSDSNDLLTIERPNTQFNRDGDSTSENFTVNVDNDGVDAAQIGQDGDQDGALLLTTDDISGQAVAGTFVNLTLEANTGVTFDTRKDSSATTTSSTGSNQIDVRGTGGAIDTTSDNVTVTERTVAIGLDGDMGAGDTIEIDELFVNATSDASNTTLSVTTNTGDNTVTTDLEKIIATQTATPGNVFGDADVSEDTGQGSQTPPGGGANFGPTGNDAAQDGNENTGENAPTVGSSTTGAVFVKNGGSAFGGATVNLDLVSQPSGTSFSSAEVLNTTRVTTASDGTAGFEFTAPSDAGIGTYTINASTSSGSVNITYEVTPGQASQFDVTGVNNSVVDQSGLSGSPGENETAAFEVRIEDSGGNLVGTQAVDVNVQVEGGELQTVTPDIANDGTSSGININDQNDNDRRDYQPGSRHSGDPVKSDFYVFASSTSPGNVDVTVSEGGVSDTGTATVFDSANQTAITLNESSVTAGDNVAVEAVAQTSDGTTIEVPRLTVGSITSNNTTVATLSNVDSNTNDTGVATATATAQANGTTQINATIAGNQASTTLTTGSGSGSPLEGTAGQFDDNEDGEISDTELLGAFDAFGSGELTDEELLEVFTAFGQS